MFFPQNAKPYGVKRVAFQTENALKRIRIEIVSDFHADAALTLRKKPVFSVCSVAGSRSRDYQSSPHFQWGIALNKRPLRRNGLICIAGVLCTDGGEHPP